MSRPFSVLIVEDDDPLRAVLADMLSQWGWSIHSTGLGQQALDIARRHPIDISILDLHLPGMTGIEVLLTISREVRPVPSIVISGQATQEEAVAALAAGAFTFLRKPLELNSLRTSVQQLVQRHFGIAPPGKPPDLPLPGLLPPPPGSVPPGFLR